MTNENDSRMDEMLSKRLRNRMIRDLDVIDGVVQKVEENKINLLSIDEDGELA